MKDDSKQSRRDFLKQAGKTSAIVAASGLALTGCGSEKTKPQDFKNSSNKKKEILYRSTQAWSSYYAVAK